MVDEFEPKPAEKSKVTLKLALEGPSGSGKTEGALALATYIAQQMAMQRGEPDSWSVLVIDTENKTASLYADRYRFKVIDFVAPYTSDRYMKAMQRGITGGFDVSVVDSLSHQWEGEGSVMNRKEQYDTREGGNSYTNWAKFSSEHTSFVEFLKRYSVHTIATMRTKTEYVLEENERGKKVPRKIGTKPIQRAEIEYEFSIVFDLDRDTHLARVSKDRTSLFGNEEALDLKNPEVARKIWNWLNSGVELTLELLTREDISSLAVKMKDRGIAPAKLSEFRATLGYDATAKVPRSRIFELLTWIDAQPMGGGAEVSRDEKMARQTMDSLRMPPSAQADLIKAHKGNWGAVLGELERVTDEQNVPLQREPVKPKTAEPAYAFALEGDDLFCYVSDAVRRETKAKREYYDITIMGGTVGGLARLVCWHQRSLFPALSEAKGKECQFVIQAAKEGQPYTIEDVKAIGAEHYTGGKRAGTVNLEAEDPE